MHIDNLIARLQHLKKQHGNARVMVDCEKIGEIIYCEPLPDEEEDYINICPE